MDQHVRLELEPETLRALYDMSNTLPDPIRQLAKVGTTPIVPQVVAIGDKSSGKSSALEALTALPFVVNKNAGADLAVRVILRKEPNVKVQATLWRDGADRKAMLKTSAFKTETLRHLITQASKALRDWERGEPTREPELRIEIYGPDVPDLTLVDIPSGFDNELLNSLLEQECTIILLVLNANRNLESQGAVPIARNFDPLEERTVTAVTTPEALVKNGPCFEQYMDFLMGTRYLDGRTPTRYILRNRNGQEVDEAARGKPCMTRAERDRKEREFFKSEEWHCIPQAKGCLALRRGIARAMQNACLARQGGE